MEALSDDEIHRRAVAQALVTLPEPSDEQAHDAVCVAIKTLATSFWNRYDNSGIEEPEILTDIRRLEHATRLLRDVERLRDIEAKALGVLAAWQIPPAHLDVPPPPMGSAMLALEEACFPEHKP